MPKPWEHPKTGAYYLNVRIPANVLSAYPGKTHIQKSLRTKSRKEAEKRLCEEWLQLQREFEQKRRQLGNHSPLTEDLTDALAQNWLAEQMDEDDLLRIEEGRFDKTLFNSNMALEIVEPEMRLALAQGRCDVIAEDVDDWLASNGYVFNRDSMAYKRTAFAFLKAYVSMLDAVGRRNRGEHIATPTATAIPQTLRLKPIIEKFLEGKDSKLEKWRKSFAALDKLTDVLGEDRLVATIKQADILEYFDIVQHLPSERGGKKRPKGVSIRELIGDTITMAPATFDNNYVAPIRVFLRWAISTYQDQGFPVGLTTDYVEYKGKREAGDQKQRAFEAHELKRLFEGEELKRFADAPENHHRYWLPVLGLHTGARINELCQINPQVDISIHEGIWALHLTADSATDERVTKSIKTKKSRYVPIHPKLIELGFLEYAERVKLEGHQLLFPEFKPKRGKASAQAAEWFGDFLEEIGVRDDTPGNRIVGAHAFRSTLLTYAANHEDPSLESRMGLITGHVRLDSNITKVMRGYISKRDMERLYGIIAQVDFGLAIPSPSMQNT